MTASSALAGVLALAGCLFSTGIFSIAAVAQPIVPEYADKDDAEQFSFDIAEIPLAQALQQYASLTRYPTLFRSELVANRTSTAIRGMYSAGPALHAILNGTGLVAEKFNSDNSRGFILKLAADYRNQDARGSQHWLVYSRLLQERIWQMLCGRAKTAPGQYRALLRFRVDAIGQIRQPTLLASTGDTSRDIAILAELQKLQMDAMPPADLPQPLAMLIVPNDAETSIRCSDRDQEVRK